MSRVPIRVRLAALVALAMMLVLAGVGLFVYLRVADDLDESLDTTLEARAAAVAASGRADAGSPFRRAASCWTITTSIFAAAIRSRGDSSELDAMSNMSCGRRSNISALTTQSFETVLRVLVVIFSLVTSHNGRADVPSVRRNGTCLKDQAAYPASLVVWPAGS